MTEVTGNHRAPSGRNPLRWKASNPPRTSGTSYIVRRKLPGESEFAFIGVSGRKKFVDDTLSFGPGVREGIHAPAVQYTAQGQRADSSGPLSPIFTVNFGKAPGGGMTARVMGGHGLEAHATNHRLEADSTRSTVDGQPVRKVLPSGNGSGKRATTRV